MSSQVVVHEDDSVVTSMVHDLLSSVRSLEVVDDSSFEAVASIYSRAKQWHDLIEEKRKHASSPARKVVSLINDKAKELTTPLQQIIDLANAKAVAYQEQVTKAATMLGLEQEKQLVTIRSPDAELVSRTKRTIRVTDINQVPRAYLMVNEERALQDIELGISKIPGLEVVEETTMSFRRK